MNSKKNQTKTIHSSLSKVDSAEGCVDQFIKFLQYSNKFMLASRKKKQSSESLQGENIIWKRLQSIQSFFLTAPFRNPFNDLFVGHSPVAPVHAHPVSRRLGQGPHRATK